MTVTSAIPCLQCGNIPTRTVNRARLIWQGGVTTLYTRAWRPSDRAGYIPLTDLCLSCLFNSEMAAARVLLNSIDNPSENADVWSIQCFPGYAYGKEWRDFSVLVFGREIGSDFNPDDCLWPSLGFRNFEGSASETQVWLRRVRYRNTPLYLEGRWNPTLRGEQVMLHGLEKDSPNNVVQEALRGRGLLRRLSRRGRPRNTGHYTEEEYRQRVAELFTEDSRDRTREEWAEELGVDRDTLMRYHRNWPDVLPRPRRS